MRLRGKSAILWLLIVSRGDATAGPPVLQDLFKTETVLAAPALKMKSTDLDADAALAVAASGLSWRPVVGGHPLFIGEGKKTTFAPAEERLDGYRIARGAGDAKSAFSFALSLALDPPEGDHAAWASAYQVVAAYDDGLDRVIVGILSAPDRVPFLPKLSYAAADLLVLRAGTKHIPLYLALAKSGDSYLRSRGVAGLGIVACTEKNAGLGPVPGLRIPIRVNPVSEAQRGMFLDVIERAAGDRSYRVRGAAALAIGLAGGDQARTELVRLSRDRAYLRYPGSSRSSYRVVFPVRATAEVMLMRLGVSVERSGGEFSERALRGVTRGCRDVTHDMSGMRRDRISRIIFNDYGW
jgi:hypothetical protein